MQLLIEEFNHQIKLKKQGDNELIIPFYDYFKEQSPEKAYHIIDLSENISDKEEYEAVLMYLNDDKTINQSKTLKALLYYNKNNMCKQDYIWHIDELIIESLQYALSKS